MNTPSTEGESRLNKIIGENIRRLRKANRWTLADVADALQVKKPTVHRWETGKNGISIYNLAKLQKLFEVPLDVLVFGVAFESPKKSSLPTVKLDVDC